MKSTKRILCAFLAVLTLLTLAAAGSVRPAYAAKTAAELEEEQRKAAQIAALEQKKKEQQEKLKELEKQIAEAKAKKEDVMVTKNLLDQRNQLLLEQIDDTQNQIDDAAAQIARYELLEQEQYELFCQQVRSEEERGSLSYLSVLFKATSMADLLNRMEFVNEVAEYNKTLIAAMKETRENIKAEKTEMEAKEAKLGEQQDELQGKLDETTKLINEYAADQKALEQLHAAEEKAAEKAARPTRQEAAAQKPSGSTQPPRQPQPPKSAEQPGKANPPKPAEPLKQTQGQPPQEAIPPEKEQPERPGKEQTGS